MPVALLGASALVLGFLHGLGVDHLMAMWLADIGLIQFYDCEGNMLRTVNLFAEIAPLRMAA